MLQRKPFSWPLRCMLILAWAGAGASASQEADALVKALSGSEAGRVREARLNQWWRNAKFGLFIHWGPASLSGAEISWGMKDRIEGGAAYQRVERDVYMNLYRQFNPVKFDADAWMRLAKEAGMKYVVFVTKHHDGFSMWPTRQVRFTENAGLPRHYSIADTPYERDLCRSIAEAAHRHGLKLGWYYSTRDWTHPDYLAGDNSIYNRYYEAQVRELLTDYGKVDMMWFDHCFGDWSQYTLVDLFKEMYTLQGDLLVNNRAARGLKGIPAEEAQLVMGDYDTPEQRIGTFQRARAWESCVTMTDCADGGGWSYRPDGRTRTLKECLRMLVSTVTGDGNLLLNIGPTPAGQFRPQEIANLKGMGRWLRKFGESIYGTRGGPYHNGSWGGSCYQGNTLYLHVFEWAGDMLQLPALKAQVLRADVLTGGTVELKRSDANLTLVLTGARPDEIDTVIKLELDSPAENEFIDGKPLEVSPPAPLTLASPLDYQVFQRQTWREGQVRIRGRVPAGTTGLQVRFTGESQWGDLPGAWTAVAFDPDDGSFDASRKVPAGGWYACQVRAFRHGQLIGRMHVPHVGVGEVFVVAGQSNSSNHGSQRQRPASGMVSAFDGNRWRPAHDPQPGGSGQGGSFIPAFGDAMTAKYRLPIGVASVGVGATSVREWLPEGERMANQPTTGRHVREVGPHEWESTGELFDKLASRLAALGPRGCRAILWHQGESDAGQARSGYPADRQISGEQYTDFMARLIRASRALAGWKVPWVVALATYHSQSDPGDEEFRAAQAALWRCGLAVEGPDSDALGPPYRDGVHFNAAGLKRHGQLWAERVGAWLDRFRRPD